MVVAVVVVVLPHSRACLPSSKGLAVTFLVYDHRHPTNADYPTWPKQFRCMSGAFSRLFVFSLETRFGSTRKVLRVFRFSFCSPLGFARLSLWFARVPRAAVMAASVVLKTVAVQVAHRYWLLKIQLYKGVRLDCLQLVFNFFGIRGSSVRKGLSWKSKHLALVLQGYRRETWRILNKKLSLKQEDGFWHQKAG